jgi:hypothetical protein
VVTSVQLPSGSATGIVSGPSSVYTFGYGAPAGSVIWGELHSLTRYSLLSGSDVTPCVSQIAAFCKQQYNVTYAYKFDAPASHRVMGTLINPIVSRTITYQELRDGTLPGNTLTEAIS